jgi:hypothetical protein
MNFFKVTETKYFKNKVFGEGELLQGETYFSYTHFAEEAVDHGFGEIISIDPLPFKIIEPDNFNRQNPGAKKILLFFAGGYGDAVMMGMILPSLKKKLGAQIDLCCSKEKWIDIFLPLNVKGTQVSYPPSLQTLSFYDGVITDITIFFTAEGIKISPILQICSGFGLDTKELSKVKFQLDDGTIDKLRLPDSSTPRIGVNLDSNGLIKSYPPALHIELIKRLKEIGVELFLFGHTRIDHILVPDELAFDLRNKTTIPSLAALLRQMDLIIGMDSFICHMANVLEIPTMVLLSTTSPDFFSLHSNITCISSRMGCAPCYHVFDVCPHNNKECMAFYHESIAPSVIASKALEYLVNSFKKKMQAVQGNELYVQCPADEVPNNLYEDI